VRPIGLTAAAPLKYRAARLRPASNAGQAGRRTSLARGSGVVTSYGYDAAGRLASLSHDPAGTGYDLTLGFAYNPAGQIVANTRSDDSYAYTGHANAGVTDVHDGLNQVVTTGGLAVDHNSRGDITRLPTPGSPAGNSTEYTYSDEDRLVTAEVNVTLTYDPLGRLHQVSSPAGSRRFLYDGGNLLVEYDAAGAQDHRYIHGPGVDDLLVWDDRSLYPTVTRRYAHADERGSVIAYSDGNDNVTHVNRYDEYGRPQGGALHGGFGYTGQMWVPELGMYYYRARIYHPGLGRFMQPDPVGYESGMNRYAYVRGDPVNLVDPLGLDVCTGTLVPSDKPCVRDHGGSFLDRAGFSGEAAGAFLGLTSGGSGSMVFVPGIPGSVTSTGSGQNQHITVTAGTSGFFIFAGGFGATAGTQFADLNRLERFLARTTYENNPRLRRNIAAMVRRFGGQFTQREIDQVLNDILRGESTSMEGLMQLGRININQPLSPAQIRLLNTYIGELPATPLNNRVRQGWLEWRRGGG